MDLRDMRTRLAGSTFREPRRRLNARAEYQRCNLRIAMRRLTQAISINEHAPMHVRDSLLPSPAAMRFRAGSMSDSGSPPPGLSKKTRPGHRPRQSAGADGCERADLRSGPSASARFSLPGPQSSTPPVRECGGDEADVSAHPRVAIPETDVSRQIRLLRT